jgi:Lsr2
VSTRIETRWVDDLDGGAADETVRFAYEGVAYEIDLSLANAARLRKALDPFVDRAARPVIPRQRKPRTVPVPPPPRADPGQRVVREWLRARGVDVPSRGRIAAHLIDAYRCGNLPVEPAKTSRKPGTVGAEMQIRSAANGQRTG